MDCFIHLTIDPAVPVKTDAFVSTHQHTHSPIQPFAHPHTDVVTSRLMYPLFCSETYFTLPNPLTHSLPFAPVPFNSSASVICDDGAWRVSGVCTLRAGRGRGHGQEDAAPLTET